MNGECEGENVERWAYSVVNRRTEPNLTGKPAS